VNALVLLADGFEDISFLYPWYRLREEGVRVTLAAALLHAAEGVHGYRVEPDVRIHEVNPAEYDLLIIPDGPAAEKLRQVEAAVDLARTFMQESQVAAIGHGAQLLISAGALDNRTVTCSPGIRDDVRAAGANYRDEAAIVDGNLLTGRGADDLPEFGRAVVRFLRSAAVR
jgi:protease I